MSKRRRGTAIVESSNGILVVSEHGRVYGLPGGGAKRGESREKAALRELEEETGLKTTKSSFLFEFTSHYNSHKVFHADTVGFAEPKHEVKRLAWYNGSNVHVTNTTKKIIEMYRGMKQSALIALRCSHCGAPLNTTGLIKCDFCGTIYIKNIP